VRDVLDHEPTWRQVVTAATETGVAADEAAAAEKLLRYLDAPADELVSALAPRGFVPGADLFNERIARLFR
jgi:alpha-L-rhamnosidase